MRCLLYIVVLLVATACSFSNPHAAALDEAQDLMDDDPSAALARLDGMDISEFRDSATMARWALLYSEAMVVNRLSAPTDTIINIAVDYYGRHNRKAEFQKADKLKALILSPNPDNLLATYRYIQKEKEFRIYKERTKRELYTVVGLTVILLACAVILWMRQRMKMQALRNDALMAEASGLKRRIEDGLGDKECLEAKLRGLLESRFGLIDSLCQTYYESQGTKIERKAIIEKVKGEIESLRTDSFPKMEGIVNDCCDNLLVRVKECCPDMKAADYQLLVYLAGGLSSRTISLLLCESVDVVYKRKSRLKSRLRESAAHFCPEIMRVF